MKQSPSRSLLCFVIFFCAVLWTSSSKTLALENTPLITPSETAPEAMQETTPKTATADKKKSQDGVTPSATSEESQGDKTQAKEEEKKTIAFTAKYLEFTQDNASILAKTDVKSQYGIYALSSQKALYNIKQRILSLEGDVQLHSTQGYSAQATKAVLDATKTNGMASDVSAEFEGLKLKAKHVSFEKSGKIITLKNLSLTTCKSCKYPAWSFNASSAKRNADTKTTIFKNATFRVFNIPIFYLPFFSQKDPSVKRVAGLLPFSFLQDSDFGFGVRIPIFLPFKPNADITITPVLFTKEYPLLKLDTRYRTRQGIMSAQLSGIWTRFKPHNALGNSHFRGAILSEGSFTYMHNWKTDFQFQITTDSTYLKRYNILDQPYLTSHIHFGKLSEETPISIDAYMFQNLQNISNLSEDLTLAAPVFSYEKVFHHAPGKLTLNIDGAVVSCSTCGNSRYVSGKLTWEQSLLFYGQLFKGFVQLRSDLYNVDDNPVSVSTVNKQSNRFDYRLLPQIGFEWRNPWAKKGKNITQVIEPIVQFIVAPTLGSSQDIPNHDSQSVTLDAQTIFARNHYSGFDRVESGIRVNYGLRYSAYDRKQNSFEITLAQSYHVSDNDPIMREAGFNKNLSNYLEGAVLSWGNTHFFNNISLSPTNFMPQTSQLGVSQKIGPVEASASYNYYSAEKELGLQVRHQISLSATIKPFKQIELGGSWSYDIVNTRNIEASANIIYKNDCFSVGFRFSQNFTSTEDLPSNRSFGISFSLVG